MSALSPTPRSLGFDSTDRFQLPSAKNTGVGCHSLLQGIFLTQGLNTSLLHCRQILYCLSPCPRRRLKGSPLFRPEGRDGP